MGVPSYIAIMGVLLVFCSRSASPWPLPTPRTVMCAPGQSCTYSVTTSLKTGAKAVDPSMSSSPDAQTGAGSRARLASAKLATATVIAVTAMAEMRILRVRVGRPV